MHPQMTQISPIEAHLRNLRNLWIKIQVIRENALLNQASAAFPTLRCGINSRFPNVSAPPRMQVRPIEAADTEPRCGSSCGGKRPGEVSRVAPAAQPFAMLQKALGLQDGSHRLLPRFLVARCIHRKG